LVYIGPLNLFFYSWRFLRELRLATSYKALKIACLGFEIISIIVLPLAFYCIVPVWIIANAKSIYYGAHLKINEALHFN
jgi:hypothetical protein